MAFSFLPPERKHHGNELLRTSEPDQRLATTSRRRGSSATCRWPYAVAQLRLADPTAFWEVRRFDGLPYLKTEAGYFVEVAVTVQGVTLSQIHPVLDGKNRPIFEPTAFDINTSIQRCLVKAIALHGLGLYIYAGEDLPDGESVKPTPPKAPVASITGDKITPGAAALRRAADRRDRQRPHQSAGLLRRQCADRAQQPCGEPRHHLAREATEGGMNDRQARPRQRRVARPSAQVPQRQRDAHCSGRFAVADAVPTMAAQARTHRAGGHPRDAARHAAGARGPGRL